MAETKEITRLHVVTDSENGYDNIGDIDGGRFDEQWLVNHIKNHGAQGLIHRLSQMITQVCLTETHYRHMEEHEKTATVSPIPKNNFQQ